MAKVKVKTLIGATAGVLFFLTATVAFLFYAFPQWLASATGLGPYDGQRILTFCALLNAAIFLLGWMTEKAFSYAGKAGLYLHWGNSQRQAMAHSAEIPSADGDGQVATYSDEQMSEHLEMRYGRRWRSKVRILLVQGNTDETEKAAPGLCHDLWQEGDGNVLVYGGDAQSLPDEHFLSRLKRLRPGKPVDGIIHVMDTAALPTDTERDAFLRCRQKADYLQIGRAHV